VKKDHEESRRIEKKELLLGDMSYNFGGLQASVPDT